MQPGISTYLLLQQRLHPSHLDAFARAGARHVELFAARYHFDYTDRQAVREIAAWFRSSDVRPHLHQPLDTETSFSRHAAPTLNLIDRDKSRRIDAMDEIKRALETAEQIPFATAVLHLGMPPDKWSEWSLEHSLTAIEHLKAFATPLGVRIVLENLQNEVTTPAHLLEVLKVGHFDQVGICFNPAHAHLSPEQPTDGILPAFDLLKTRIATLRLSDNDGRADARRWPFTVESNGIDWPSVLPLLNTLPPATPSFFTVAHEPGAEIGSLTTRFTETLDAFRRLQDSSAP